MPGRTVPILDATSQQSSLPGPSFDLDQLRTIESGFQNKCRQTTCQFPIHVVDNQEHVDSWLTGAQQIPPASQVSALTCTKCWTSTCIGCGSEPSLSQESIFTTVGVVNSCCPQGRLFGVWLLLGNFDEREVSNRPTTNGKSVKSKAVKSLPNGGPHFSASNASGIGYAGGWDPYYHPSHNLASSSKFDDPEAENPDEMVMVYLKLLAALIPEAQAQMEGVILEHVLCLFRHSILLDHLAELLRNDSIADLVERRDLYTTIFKFLEIVADHPFLRQMLFEKRLNKKNSPGLRALSRVSSGRSSQFSQQDLLASVFANGSNLFKQAQSFIRMSEKEPSSAVNYGKEAIRMCKVVTSIFTKIQHEIARADDLDRSENQNSWMKFCEDNRVTFTDDVLTVHRYKDQFSALKTSNKGRLTAIGKEIANMTTSLPDGVFVKVAESRSDVMKVLIIGIEGTPYAGGLFCFDLFLDANYPTSPPKMLFTLDGNDSEGWSFNPNLHKGSDTVCLSLINTWQGSAAEMWQPGKSTILAVLISIQAMILGSPVPWINEPGYSQQEKTPEAQEHKLLIQYKTVRYAMIGWLEKRSDSKYAVWDEIQKEYWKHHGLNALMLAEEWTKDNKLISKGVASRSGKKVKRFSTLTLPKEDLRLKLATLLDLTSHLGPPTPEQESPISATTRSKGKLRAKGSKKRTADVLSDDSEDLPDDDYAQTPLPPVSAWAPANSPAKPTKKQKTSAATTKSKGKLTGKGKGKGKKVEESEDEQIEDTALLLDEWVYTGPKTQKETRAACSDFGISGAKSIKDTIIKLEMFVNENHLGESTFGLKWGLYDDDL